MENATNSFNKTGRRLAAATVCGNILVGYTVLAGQAVAAPTNPEVVPVSSVHLRDIGRLVAQHSQHEVKAKQHRLLVAKHEHIVKAKTAESNALYAEWTKVAVCEEGGWVGSSGVAFPDSLGITSANWYANGGGSDVSPAAQIKVAERLITGLGISVPDQAGCDAGGW